MNRSKLFALLLGSLLASASILAQVPQDSIVMYQKDSAIIPDTDPTVLFFQENERLSPDQIKKTVLITRAKKTTTLAAFLKSGDMQQYGDEVLADLDNDGKKELLVSNFTGGAHCCDELYVFKNIGPNKYQHVAKLFAGHTVITPAKEFEYSFNEQYGYFFTCYACGYTDTTDEAPVDVSSITLRYSKGKMMVVPGDAELKSTIYDNLGKLGELPYPAIDPDLGQDEGLRKEFAFNLARYYFSFGRNIAATQQLFNKYYKFPDAKKVWAAFVKQLQYMKKDNDF